MLLPILSRRHKSFGYLCFLNSRGEVTAYHHGQRKWQVRRPDVAACGRPHVVEHN